MDGYWTTTRTAIKSWPTTLRLALLLTIPSTPPLLILLLK